MVGALAGAGFLLFNEMQTVIEIIGSLAVAQFALTSLLSSPSGDVEAAKVTDACGDGLSPNSAIDEPELPVLHWPILRFAELSRLAEAWSEPISINRPESKFAQRPIYTYRYIWYWSTCVPGSS